VFGAVVNPLHHNLTCILALTHVRRLCSTLTDAFPDAAPIVSVVERITTHPWLDDQQRVVRSPELNAWSRERNLGQAVLSVIQHFGTHPPAHAFPSGPPSFPAPGGPLAGRAGMMAPGSAGMSPGGTGAGGGSGSPFPVPAGGGFSAGMQAPGGPGSGAPAAGAGGVPPHTPIGGPGSAAGSSGSGRAGAPSPGVSAGVARLSLARQDSLSSEVKLEDLNGLAASHRGAGGGVGGVGHGGGASAGGGSGHGGSHTMLPPVPSSFPALEAMSMDELRTLQEDDTARTGFLASCEEFRVLAELAAGQRDATAKLARENMAKAAELRAAGEALQAAQEAVRAKQATLAALLQRQKAAGERFNGPRLARELQTTATQLSAMTEELVEAFSSSGGAAGTPGGDGSGTPAFGPGGGGGVDPRLRRFSEDFVALRKRYHLACAKRDIVQQVGFEPPTAS